MVSRNSLKFSHLCNQSFVKCFNSPIIGSQLMKFDNHNEVRFAMV
jgi:hypothetical protein